LDDRSRQKTALDEPRPGKATLVDPVSPSTRGSVDRPKPSDKTVIYNPADAAAGPSAQAAAGRKLVGWIVTYDIQSNGTDFRIFEGRSKIGRSGANDIVINQPGVSETHCLLLYRDRKLCIQDEMSSNGTFVNGVSIEEKVVLNDNDMVTLGKVNFKVKLI
jgi:pSer/pThr/pTyr-binding forkhead associated (FHA) protein